MSKFKLDTKRRDYWSPDNRNNKPIKLVDGSYDSGHVAISNGHTFGISNARQGVVVQVPLTKSMDTLPGDTISLMLKSTNGKAQYWGIVLDGTVTQVVGGKPSNHVWYSFPIQSRGTLSAIYVKGSEYDWTITTDVSLKLNEEVIF